jgi:hypothetical protein
VKLFSFQPLAKLTRFHGPGKQITLQRFLTKGWKSNAFLGVVVKGR